MNRRKFGIIVGIVLLGSFLGVLGVAIMLGKMLSPAPVAAPVLQTDPEPLRKRFVALADFSSCQWIGGSIGNPGGLPGPSDVYIKGIIRLSPRGLDALRIKYQWIAATLPEVPDPLRKEAESNDWQKCDSFTKDAMPAGFDGHLYLDPKRQLVYVDVQTY